ncbi:hypothetical protein SAMN05216413_0174 [Ruminococcaceae bacterium KH2T8]|nr:hypothetical protein SAMN05216413_0174 [Ruminococcaceae bacterium KH2T8]
MNTRKTKLTISILLIMTILISVASCGVGGSSSRKLSSIQSFKVSSTSISGTEMWIDQISNTSVGENKTPQLSWSPVAGAEEYLIYMFDETSDMFVHWKAIDVHETSLPLGWGDSVQTSEYIGPYPPSGTHRYVIYVFALKERSFDESTLPSGAPRSMYFPGSVGKPLEFDFDKFISQIDRISTDEPTGNILAYGKIEGSFRAVS